VPLTLVADAAGYDLLGARRFARRLGLRVVDDTVDLDELDAAHPEIGGRVRRALHGRAHRRGR
jgi:hypothetical protein